MQTFPEYWLRPTPLSAALLPVSWLFAAASAARRSLFRLRVLPVIRLPVPVIVVGNVLVGGTGKTPLVLALLERLREAGYRPGVLIRGYGGTSQSPVDVRADDDPYAVGDEAVLIAARSGCPVCSGRDRGAAGRKLLQMHPQCNVLVSDDGLQHYRLARDFEIAVEDSRGHGNGRMLPAGPLREPGGRRVDALVVNGEPHPARRAEIERIAHRFRLRLEPEGFYALDDPQTLVDARELAGKRLHALAGIGDPRRFFVLLREMGLEAVEHSFPDHHRFSAGELDFSGCDALVMTEKDAVKCARLARENSRCGWYALRVRAWLDPSFFELILKRLAGAHHGYPAA